MRLSRELEHLYLGGARSITLSIFLAEPGQAEEIGIFALKEISVIKSVSAVLPAHNEEAAIAETVRSVLATLASWMPDYEVIVVDDGSRDKTGVLLDEIAREDAHLRVIHHVINQGYGAALVSGFEASSKEYVFFMDSDGQFDIRDLEKLFPLLSKYDAVLGYRIKRQDTWMRKLNAWSWKQLVRQVFKVRVRDVDCAFKIYTGQFFRENRLETRGAMINTEILYKLKRAGYNWTEVGVHHLPRNGGKATGAKWIVIIRAFRELFTYARKWHREERLGLPIPRKTDHAALAESPAPSVVGARRERR